MKLESRLTLPLCKYEVKKRGDLSFAWCKGVQHLSRLSGSHTIQASWCYTAAPCWPEKVNTCLLNKLPISAHCFLQLLFKKIYICNFLLINSAEFSLMHYLFTAARKRCFSFSVESSVFLPNSTLLCSLLSLCRQRVSQLL